MFVIELPDFNEYAIPNASGKHVKFIRILVPDGFNAVNYRLHTFIRKHEDTTLGSLKALAIGKSGDCIENDERHVTDGCKLYVQIVPKQLIYPETTFALQYQLHD